MAGLLDTPKRVTGGLLGVPPEKAGFVDYALATLVGGVGGAAGLGLQQRQSQRQYSAQMTRLGELSKAASAAGLTPEEQFSLALDPQKALDMLAERTKPRDVAGGNSLYIGGQYKTAPKVGIDGGFGYSQTPDGIKWQDQRGINHQEIETERHNIQGEEHDTASLAEASRHNKEGEGVDWGQLGVSRGQLGVAQQRLAFDKTGGVGAVGGGKPTDAQAQAGFNAARLANAGKTLDALEAKNFDGSRAGVGAAMYDAKSRSYDQAASEWADALLRLTSGAQAPKEEVAKARSTYFPVIGDSLLVRTQKAAARRAAMSEASRRAGPAAPAQGGGYRVLSVK